MWQPYAVAVNRPSESQPSEPHVSDDRPASSQPASSQPASSQPALSKRLEFAVTYDYRCPFACNAHDHLVTALSAGADWDVSFMPFSLGQAHVEEGGPSVWDDPRRDTGMLALQASIAVRDNYPDHFLDIHGDFFNARHRLGRKLQDPIVIYEILTVNDLDADEIFNVIRDGQPLETIRTEHERAAADHDVWGVPTFVVGDKAAFVRLMSGPAGDTDAAAGTIERIVSMLSDWPELNEFKHTSLES